MAIKRFILPINASGTIQNLRTTTVTQTTIALAWDAYPGATAYQVYRSTTQGSLGTLVLTPTATNYSNSGHTAGTSYTYAVRPVVGGSGVASAGASISVTTASSSWQLAAGNFVPAKWAPVIVGPSPDIASASAYSRYRLAPDGIAWRVPISVSGGAFPFYFEVVSGPSGMVIGQQYGQADYGVLSWANPTIGSHPITVRVTDQQGTPVTRSWTLVVRDKTDTNYFLFVNAATGVDAVGRGSYSAPFASILGWYGTTPGATTGVSSVTYPNQQVFYYSGTYRTNVITDPQGSNSRVVFQSGRKPYVHITMPGNSPIFDCQDYFVDMGNCADVAFSGILFANGNQIASGIGTKHSYVRQDNPARCLYFESTFGPTTGGTAEGTNSACVMFTGLRTDYSVFSRCTFDNPQGSDFLLNYGVDYIVFENCTISGYVNETNGHALYLKSSGAQYVSIRNNVGDCTDEFVELDSYTSDGVGTFRFIEVCWNRIKSSTTPGNTSGAPIRMKGGSAGVTLGDVFVYRNNFYGATDIEHSTSSITISTNPTVIYEKNVMEGVGIASGPIITTSNDSAATTDVSGFLDAATNLLTGAARTSYLGTHGSEVY